MPTSIAPLILDLVKDAMFYVTSADKAYHWLREVRKMDIPRAVVREAWRAIGEKEYWGTVIQTWREQSIAQYGHERAIPKAWVVENPRLKAGNYQYYFRCEVFYPDTGTYGTKTLSHVSDKYITIGEAWEEFATRLIASEVLGNFTVVDWKPGGVARKPH